MAPSLVARFCISYFACSSALLLKMSLCSMLENTAANEQRPHSLDDAHAMFPSLPAYLPMSLFCSSKITLFPLCIMKTYQTTSNEKHDLDTADK